VRKHHGRRLIVTVVLGCALGAPFAVQEALGSFPPRPTVYSVAPGRTCDLVEVYGRSGKTLEDAPPTPGLRAIALAPRRVRIYWSFSVEPSQCRPQVLVVGIVAYGNTRATPNVVPIRSLHGSSGSIVLTYPSFLPRPDVALASAYGPPPGLSSHTVKILIRR
jgi:hypothetical protein